MKGCFIRKIFEKNEDESVHSQFVRFGKGEYKSRAILNLIKTGKIKVRGSFEFANDFVNFVAELGNFNFSGTLLSRIDINDIFVKNKINADKGKKAGLYVYNVENIDSKIIMELKGKTYYLLLDVSSPELSLKIKKKLPKPGKSEGKVDDKFCQLEADLKYWNQIKDYFFWDIEANKARIEHEYEIKEILIPQGEKDFEKIRLNSKRKGRLKRKIFVGKEAEKVRECEFEA